MFPLLTYKYIAFTPKRQGKKGGYLLGFGTKNKNWDCGKACFEYNNPIEEWV
jgi:hypothetical protein